MIVGMPGAGKTTRAKELEISENALRLTPDEWQMAIFPDDGPTGWRATDRSAQRFRIEGKLIGVGMRAAQLGINVVLDFGLWAEDERSALRWIAGRLGLDLDVIYLPITYEEQRRRIAERFTTKPGQFQLDDDELRQWHGQFQPPGPAELSGGPIPAPPPGSPTWSHWAHQHWTSLPDEY